MSVSRNTAKKAVTCTLLCAMLGMGLKLAAADSVRPAGMRQVLELLSDKKSWRPVLCSVVG